MERQEGFVVDSPIGKHEIDAGGSPVGVVRMETDRSYAGVGALLRDHIDHGDPGAWDEIKRRIDYTFENLDLALAPLDAETGFADEVKARVGQGQKLLFKPNLVNPHNIDPQTHGPGSGETACTEWSFVAALMRWFHDKLGISYYEMAVGEAATGISAAAGHYSILNSGEASVTPEAVIEGKAGNFHGGWGFYYARKYLAETLDPSRDDDPMQGYQESVTGAYLAPGHVSDKLMVYDLNRVCDDADKGRAVDVTDGVNYRSIILHKAVVGGDPADLADREKYPGCVLINVPKLKVHGITLLTNVIKNLGIGLYPMQVTVEGRGSCQWEYSMPHTTTPGIKGSIPHQIWVPEMDMETGVPKRDADGRYVVKKTGGILATMVDIIKAVRDQGIYMFHVVDAIEAINLDHQGALPGTKHAEGLVFAGADPVAADLLCARYLFTNVSLKEAAAAEAEAGTSRFLQRVPVPAVEEGQIVTGSGYDSPLERDISFQYAEERGLGSTTYHAVGHDTVAGCPMVSLQGRLGVLTDGRFRDLVTETLYFDAFQMPWDLQRTVFGYFDAVDEVTGSSVKQTFLDAYEDGDGVVTYEELGKKGAYGPILHLMGSGIAISGTEELGYLRGPFSAAAIRLKWAQSTWNEDGHDVYQEPMIGATCLIAYQMSQSQNEVQDPFAPSLTWGRGKWPSFQLAAYARVAIALYGIEFQTRVGFFSLFGQAFRYADLTQNAGKYSGQIATQPEPDGLDRYVTDVANGKAGPLDFTLYVPSGFGALAGPHAPHVQETDDPAKILTVQFEGGKEVWPDTTVRD